MQYQLKPQEKADIAWLRSLPYLLKEKLRLTPKAEPDEIPDALTKWMAWVQWCN